jgi:hypothetical protein
MNAEEMPRRVLACHAPDEAFAPMTRVILARLGYIIVPQEEVARSTDSGSDCPDLRLVDERRLGEIPDEGPNVPIVLLTGRKGAAGDDARVRGALRRPAGIHEIYRLVQQLLEDNPRTSPRVSVDLPARCTLNEHEWESSLRSISENGCLIRTSESVDLGQDLHLQFELPETGRLEIGGEVAYQLMPDIGVVFHTTSPKHREAIARYVNDTLVVS